MPGLPRYQLRLVIADAVVGGIKEPFQPRRPITLDEMIAKLWRENPETVRRLFHEIADKRAAVDPYRLRLSKKSDNRGETTSLNGPQRRPRRPRRPRLTRNKRGLTLSEIARQTHMDPPTLTALLEHHGFLELVPYGWKRRRLVTDTAFHAGVGHNVVPKNRIGHLEGYGKAMAFPVFYRDRLEEILWSLDFQGIAKVVEGLRSKRKRLAWLLDNHGYLPNREIATLAGCSEIGVKKARARAKVSSCVIVDQRGSVRVEPRSQGQAAHQGQLTGRTIRLPSWASDRDAQGPIEVAEAA